MINSYLQYLNEFDYVINEIELLIEGNSIKSISNKIKNNSKSLNRFLISHGVNLSKFKNISKNIYNIVYKAYENKETPSQVAKKILDKLKKVLLDIVNVAKKKDKTLTEKILLAIIFGCSLYIFNGVLGFIFKEDTFLGELIVGPMTEELLKWISIDSHIPYITTGLTFGFEFFQYILKYSKQVSSVPKYFIVRIIGLIIHFITLLIQKGSRNIESDKLSPFQKNFIAYVIAVIIHFLWNAGGGMFLLGKM